MKNIKPLTSSDILLIRIKGIFPYFIHLSVLQSITLTLWLLGYISALSALIPHGIIALYYIGYLTFIALAKFSLRKIKKYDNTNI